MHNQSSIQSSLKPAQSLGANLVEVQASSKGFSTARISPQNHSCVGFGQWSCAIQIVFFVIA